MGGTFNPPHLGHLICAQEAYLQLELEAVVLIPARIPPHKSIGDEPGAEHRLELCRLAVQDDRRLQVSDLEIHRDGPSYTVDTLQELHDREPDCELFLIVGGDIAAGLPGWYQPERVLQLATLAVARRRGTPTARVRHALEGLRHSERTRFFSMPRIAISSTTIRSRVKQGLAIKYLVPDAVSAYIDSQRLYVGS